MSLEEYVDLSRPARSRSVRPLRGVVAGWARSAALGAVLSVLAAPVAAQSAGGVTADPGQVIVRDARAAAINDAGTIVGVARAGRAFLKPASGGSIDIDVTAPMKFVPAAISSDEVVVGALSPIDAKNNFRNVAAYWTRQTGHRRLPTHPNAPNSGEGQVVIDVDDQGNVLMVAPVTSGAGSANRIFLFNINTQQYIQLPCPNESCVAMAMNDSGVVLGRASRASAPFGASVVVWDRPTQAPRQLGNPSNNSDILTGDINSSGAIVVSGIDGQLRYIAVWLPEDAVPRIILNGEAGAINDQGIIAGAYIDTAGSAGQTVKARLWRVQSSRTAVYDLVVPESAPASVALEINNRGTVLGMLVDAQQYGHAITFANARATD